MKKKNITYEELMNSHFMRFPSHSRILHIIFNPICLCVVLFPLITFISWAAGVPLYAAIMIASIAGGIVPLKQFRTQAKLRGHGVGLIKKDGFTFLGMPKTMSLGAIIMGFVLLVMVLAVFFGPSDDPHVTLNFKALSLSLFVSHIISLLSWRFHTYSETWYGDEYKARMEFKKRGMKDSEIEEYIQRLRKMGILE